MVTNGFPMISPRVFSNKYTGSTAAAVPGGFQDHSMAVQHRIATGGHEISWIRVDPPFLGITNADSHCSLTW